MRELAVECMLTEEVKWSVPCYTVNGKNVMLVASFIDYCSFMFMKGSLLQDPNNLLHRQTENVTSGRQLRYTSMEEFMAQRNEAKAFILEAIALEKAGRKVEKLENNETIVDELTNAFEVSEAFKMAFYKLTSGRQRAYLLYFAQPKQTTTRIARIEKCIPMILRGEGLYDAYQSKKN
jgi:uncharacterized protein YdeI (YjbR/CyaY-like superfamily)